MSQDLVRNKKAFYDYEVLETFEAGLLLQGTEIKSLRSNGGSLQDAYVDVRSEAPYLLQCYIAPYSHGNIHNHEERRPRKLLLHKREFAHLRQQVIEKGLTVIPLAIFLNKKGFAKVKIGIARGKKAHDKRAAIKERDAKRALRSAENE